MAGRLPSRPATVAKRAGRRPAQPPPPAPRLRGKRGPTADTSMIVRDCPAKRPGAAVTLGPDASVGTHAPGPRMSWLVQRRHSCVVVGPTTTFPSRRTARRGGWRRLGAARFGWRRAVAWHWRGRAPPGPREGLSPPPLAGTLPSWAALPSSVESGTRAPGSGGDASCPSYPAAPTWISSAARLANCTAPPRAAMQLPWGGCSRFRRRSPCRPPSLPSLASTASRAGPGSRMKRSAAAPPAKTPSKPLCTMPNTLRRRMVSSR